MMDAREYLNRCRAAKAWLEKQGVADEAVHDLRFAVGHMAADGHFEVDHGGDGWIVFPDRDDCVFWKPTTGDTATWYGRAFAIGEDAIDNPATYAFDCQLNIFATPLEWLRAKRDGIVVVDWLRAFDRLRDCPRVVIAEEILLKYKRHMRPARLPEVSVLITGRAVAA